MMTEKKLNDTAKPGPKPPRGFFIEGERCGRGMSFEIGKVISISELSEECIELKTHGGRIIIGGSRLTLSIFEGGTVKVDGKVTEVKLVYGKA